MKRLTNGLHLIKTHIQTHYSLDMTISKDLKSCFVIHVTTNSLDNILLSVRSFGKRSGGGGRRTNECLILEPSEMLVVSTAALFPPCLA